MVWVTGTFDDHFHMYNLQLELNFLCKLLKSYFNITFYRYEYYYEKNFEV